MGAKLQFDAALTSWPPGGQSVPMGHIDNTRAPRPPNRSWGILSILATTVPRVAWSVSSSSSTKSSTTNTTWPPGISGTSCGRWLVARKLFSGDIEPAEFLRPEVDHFNDRIEEPQCSVTILYRPRYPRHGDRPRSIIAEAAPPTESNCTNRGDTSRPEPTPLSSTRSSDPNAHRRRSPMSIAQIQRHNRLALETAILLRSEGSDPVCRHSPLSTACRAVDADLIASIPSSSGGTKVRPGRPAGPPTAFHSRSQTAASRRRRLGRHQITLHLDRAAPSARQYPPPASLRTARTNQSPACITLRSSTGAIGMWSAMVLKKRYFVPCPIPPLNTRCLGAATECGSDRLVDHLTGTWGDTVRKESGIATPDRSSVSTAGHVSVPAQQQRNVVRAALAHQVVEKREDLG